MMDELGRFITVDKHEAVKISDLGQGSVVLPAAEPKFRVDCPKAAVREGVEELTRRRGE